MPSYKLTYFPARGRAEVARQMFYLSGVPFEDNRVPMAEWPTLKPHTPFGTMPVLEVDGKEIPQSYAIFRYLAKEFGFVGDNAFESAWVDAVADQHKDYFAEIFPFLAVVVGFKEGDKDQLLKDVAIPARDKYFTLLEKIAKDNHCNGHFVGASLTWVDLLIADHVNILLKYMPDFLDAYPSVVKTVQKIEATPKLKEWFEKRPDSTF